VSLTEVLPALGGVVVERLDDGLFAVRSDLPEWLSELRGTHVCADVPFELEEVFPFLGVFLPAAEAAWHHTPPARADSDFWTETDHLGNDIHLEASAIRIDDRPVLVVMRNERLFAGGQSMLQRARELRITHDALMRELEQKDILVHAIVHDLAAPLHSIMGILSLLDEQPHAAPASDWIRLGLRAAGRQRELISEILEVFSAESGALPMDLVEGVDIDEVLGEVLAERVPVAGSRDVRLVHDVGPPSGRVVAEKTRLFRVLTNLVDNALRHSPAGGTVLLSVVGRETSVRVCVEDQGPGVDPEILPRLFEKLTRGRDGGTGLGLFFCRITLESWGGGIGYERPENGGARFWVNLKRSVDHGKATAPR
jgi:signal transduction histidine kinase